MGGGGFGVMKFPHCGVQGSSSGKFVLTYLGIKLEMVIFEAF